MESPGRPWGSRYFYVLAYMLAKNLKGGWGARRLSTAGAFTPPAAWSVSADLLDSADELERWLLVKARFVFDSTSDLCSCNLTPSFLSNKFNSPNSGELKLSVYRKPTHTDQYLNFMSHHPIDHKISVMRTLLERSQNLASEPEDKRRKIFMFKMPFGRVAT